MVVTFTVSGILWSLNTWYTTDVTPIFSVHNSFLKSFNCVATLMLRVLSKSNSFSLSHLHIVLMLPWILLSKSIILILSAGIFPFELFDSVMQEASKSTFHVSGLLDTWEPLFMAVNRRLGGAQPGNRFFSCELVV